MAQRPKGRHTAGAVRERRINADARSSRVHASHPTHAAAGRPPASSAPADAAVFDEGAGRSDVAAPSSHSGASFSSGTVHPGGSTSFSAQAATRGRHARYVPGVGDVIERDPRVGQSSVAARIQMRDLADPDETVRLPRGLSEQRVVVDAQEAQPEAPTIGRDSLFGRYLFLFALLIIAACWYAYAALAGAPALSCSVSGAVRLLFIALRDTGASLSLPGVGGLALTAVAAYATCGAAFAWMLHQMRRTRMSWAVVLPCLAFYCAFPLWGPFGDFGGALFAAFTVLAVGCSTKALADGRSWGAWLGLALCGLVACLASDIGISVAAGIMVVVFLWTLARCGQSRKKPEQLVRADGTTWRARTQDDSRQRAREQARARRLEPQKAVGRALAVAAFIALACLLLPQVLLPVEATDPASAERNVRSLLALAPFAAWYIAGGIMLRRASKEQAPYA